MLQRKHVYRAVAVVGAIAALLVSLYGVQRQIDSKVHGSLSKDLLLSLPSGEYLKTGALGFDVLVADLIWARTVVSFGEHLLTDQDYTGLYHRLDVITTLDPLFYEVYHFGSILLAMQAGQIDEGMMLLERGIKNYPDDWRLHFIIGFYLTHYKKDDTKALKYLERAANLPGHPIYLPRLIGNLYAKIGKVDMALLFLEEAYKQFRDKKMRAEIEAQMKDLLVERHTIVLEAAAKKYKSIYGIYPNALEALTQTGLISAIPDEPHGGQYKIDPRTGKIIRIEGK